jgi:hypothetical protein
MNKVLFLLQEKTIAFGDGQPAYSLAGIQALPESFLAVTYDHRNCTRESKLAAFANMQKHLYVKIIARTVGSPF